MVKQVHVTYDKSEGNWDVKSVGASKAYRTAETKNEAVHIATQVARNNEAELIVHGMDNKIQSRNSYGNDPFPPRG